MDSSTIEVRAVSRATPMTQVSVRQHTFFIDEPAQFKGGDAAPSPVEYLLGAIAGCIAAIGCQISGEEGFSIQKLETTVRGQINSDCFLGRSDARRSGFHHIEIDLRIACDAEEAQIIRWREQLEKRCPVLDNLLHPAQIDISYERENL